MMVSRGGGFMGLGGRWGGYRELPGSGWVGMGGGEGQGLDRAL